MLPTRRCVLLFAAGFPVALLPALVSPRLWTVWVAFVAVAAFLAGLDALLGLPRRRLRAEVEAPSALFIGEPERAEVRLDAGRRGARAVVDLLLDVSGPLAPPAPLRVQLGEGGGGRASVPLAATRRGTARLEGLWLQWEGPLRLARRRTRRTLDRPVAVLPNVRAVRRAALRYFGSRHFLSGLQVQRYIGDGSEFESLREYAPGMDTRALDWKASARHRRRLCREFRAERNQQVVLAVDTGRLMGEPLLGVPKMDHAINAGLLLAYFSLRAGDRAGLFAFDAKARAFVEPEAGVHAFARLQSACAGLDYAASETNFTLAIAELSARLRRRSLVVVLTDFVDAVAAELMVENLHRLAARHLVLFVTLRDPALLELAEGRPESLADLYRAVVAHDFVRERETVLLRLRRAGIRTIDAAPSQVSVDLLNQYLEAKRRELVG